MAKKPFSRYAMLSGIAFQMIAIIAFGTFIGVKLDSSRGADSKLFTVIFSLTSVLVSIYFVIRQIIKNTKN